MPTVRKRVTRNPIKDIEPWKIEFLKFGEVNFEGLKTKEIDSIEWGILADFYTIEKRRPTWEKVRSMVMSDWIEKHPCSRPYAWWDHEAPRQDDDYDGWWFHGTLPEPRLRVGGGEVQEQNVEPYYRWGVPQHWNFAEDNPPIVESQAAYLKRLDLLTEIEKKYLSKNPDLLQPVPISLIGDFRTERKI